MIVTGEDKMGNISTKSYFEIVLKRFVFYAFTILATLPAYFVATDNRIGTIVSLLAFILFYLCNVSRRGLVRRHVWLIKFGVVIACIHIVGSFIVPEGQKFWLLILYFVIAPFAVYLNWENFSRLMDEYYPSFPWDE